MNYNNCPKCNKTSLYYSDVYGRWRCKQCNAIFTKDLIFVCYDPKLGTIISYNKDGSIKSISSTGDMLLYDQVIERQKEIINLKNKLCNVDAWWNNLSDKEKIEVYEKNKGSFI